VIEAVRRRAAWRPAARATSIATGAVLLVLLVTVSLVLRTRQLDGPFWIDEGLSVGIGSYPLTEIPGVLVEDGSPPLYYMALHVWIDVFGSGVEATHAFSLLFALLSIPAAFWAAWSLFGRRAGWAAATLAAFNPFLTIYAQEARMYALMAFLSILATAAFLHAFVFRRRRYVPVFAVLLAVMLYTHNWTLFYAAAALIALAVIVRGSSDRRGVVRDAAIAFGAAGIAYLPWVPTLLEQTRHTGAPWSRTPGLDQLFGGFLVVLSGQNLVIAIVIAGGLGLVALARRTGPSPERTAIFAAFTIAAGTLVIAWTSSQIAPAWANRYLGVLVGPVLLLAAALVPRAGRYGLAALAVVLLFWIPFQPDTMKSNAAKLGALYAADVRPGDIVLSTQPEQVPVLAYYFGRDKAYATPLGPFPDTRIMDWRDVLGELEQASTATTLEPLIDDLPPGGRIFLIRPLVRDPRAWSAPWTSLVRTRSQEWAFALARDGRFRRTEQYFPPYTDLVRRPLVLEIFEKTADG
jgi:mannosyltransferase